MAALDRYVEHVLVHTGQNYDYELNQIFFDDLEIRKPDHFLERPAKTRGRDDRAWSSPRSDAVLREIQPDAVLILGDTNSCLAAIPAKRQKIPVFHMEAGNRCFDQRVPEEINRKIVDHISDINMPYSSISREYLLREGLAAGPRHQDRQPDVRGAPPLPAEDRGVGRAGRGWGWSAASTSSSARTARRTSTVPAQFAKLVEVLNGLARAYGLRVIVSTHPRTRKTLRGRKASTLDPQVELLKPFGLLRLRQAADARPGGALRQRHDHRGIVDPELPRPEHPQAHERPEGMEEAAVMMTGLEWGTVQAALKFWRPSSAAKNAPCAWLATTMHPT